MITFLIITGLVIGVIIIMSLIKSKPKEKPKSIMDELNENPLFKIMNEMSNLNENATDNHTITQDGYGEFGYEVTNPIPVKSVLGNMAYLEKLRTLDGQKVEYERIGSTSAPNIDMPIDMYEISVNNEQITTLYISSYHNKNSERAPKNFKLVAIS